MATITLNSLKCVKLQDSISNDEIVVHINNVKVGGPYGVHKGQEVKLGQSRSFTGSTSVQLFELDGNNAPDALGSEPVSDTPVTGKTLEFDRAKNAFYTVNYTVRS